MRKYLILLFSVMALAACSKEGIEPDFILDGSIRLMNGQTVLFAYDEADCQMSFDQSKKKFAIISDDASQFCTIELSELPKTAGQNIFGTILWATDEHGIDIKSNVALEVAKTEGDKVWLWNSNGGIKAVIRVLE